MSESEAKVAARQGAFVVEEAKQGHEA